jgi:hydroxyacylglutathione hydrolase
MDYSALEDFLGDIIGKAQRGLDIDTSTLSKATGLSETQFQDLKACKSIPEDAVIRMLAEALNLNGDKLIQVARGWVPDSPNELFENETMKVERLVLDAGMTVNCYVLVCKKTGRGAIVDPGGETERIVSRVKAEGVEITHILLTHGHGDHVGSLEEVAAITGATVCGCERDFGLMGGKSKLVTNRVDGGWQQLVGNLAVSAFDLAGHTPGGIGYYTSPVFFSGDALFAGSLGGARGPAYKGQIEAVGRKVLSLDQETRIFPGHGPVTTVGQEKVYNPFFL